MDIANNAIGSDVKDRRIGILIDGNDYFRRLHTGDMLDRTRNAAGNVELGADGLSGLTHLVRVGDPSLINCTSRCCNSAAECFCQLLNHLKILSATEPAPPGHDY